MKIFFKSLLILLLLLVLQSTVFSFFPVYIKPDLVVLGLVFFALRRGPVVGVFLGFIVGLIQDIYAIQTLGSGALSKLLLGYLLGLIDESRFTFSPLTKVIFLMFGFILHDVVYNISIGLEFRTFLIAIFTVTLPTCLITAVLSVPFFYLLNPLSKEN